MQAKNSDMQKITKKDVEPLYRELIEIETYLDPKPNPNQWPPVGWAEHPTAPGMYYRVLSEAELREEIFGSEAKSDWMQWAKNRIQEIKNLLIPYFFPQPAEEGTQRREKGGFVVMLKTGLKRELDVAALASVVAECQKMAAAKKLSMNIEENLIQWKPGLKLKEFRELPADIRKEFENALIIEPAPNSFEIVRGEPDAE